MVQASASVPSHSFQKRMRRIGGWRLLFVLRTETCRYLVCYGILLRDTCPVRRNPHGSIPQIRLRSRGRWSRSNHGLDLWHKQATGNCQGFLDLMVEMRHEFAGAMRYSTRRASAVHSQPVARDADSLPPNQLSESQKRQERAGDPARSFARNRFGASNDFFPFCVPLDGASLAQRSDSHLAGDGGTEAQLKGAIGLFSAADTIKEITDVGVGVRFV